MLHRLQPTNSFPLRLLRNSKCNPQLPRRRKARRVTRKSPSKGAAACGKGGGTKGKTRASKTSLCTDHERSYDFSFGRPQANSTELGAASIVNTLAFPDPMETVIASAPCDDAYGKKRFQIPSMSAFCTACTDQQSMIELKDHFSNAPPPTLLSAKEDRLRRLMRPTLSTLAKRKPPQKIPLRSTKPTMSKMNQNGVPAGITKSKSSSNQIQSNDSTRKKVVASESGSDIAKESRKEAEKMSELQPMKQSMQQPSIFWLTGCTGKSGNPKKNKKQDVIGLSTETARPGKAKSKMSKMNQNGGPAGITKSKSSSNQIQSNDSTRKEVVASESGSDIAKESRKEAEKMSELQPMKQSMQQPMLETNLEKKESMIMKKSSVMRMEDEVVEGEDGQKTAVAKDVTKKEEIKEDRKKDVTKKEDVKMLATAKPSKPDVSVAKPNPVECRPHIVLIPKDVLEFKATFTKKTKLTIKSIHDKKVMFKIKLSDNATFQVNPVFGVVEPGKIVDVAVTHKKGPPEEAKLAVLNNVLTGDEKNVANLFKTITKPTGKHVILKLEAK